MRLFKKQVSLLMLFAMMIVAVPVRGKAAEVSDNTMNGNINLMEPSDGVVISEALTYDEMVQVIARDKKISLLEAEKIVGPRPDTTSRNSIASESYRTISKTFSLGMFGTYKPYVLYYCRTSESGAYWGIVEVLNTMLMRDGGIGLYRFEGELYTHLQSPYQIYYSISGDFYEFGEQSSTTSSSIGLDEYLTIGYSVSESNNFFDNISEYGVLQTQY